MARGTYDIVRYEPQYRDQVLAVQSHLWGADHARNNQYLAWKYEQNPYVDEPLIYLALSKGEVVAMRGMFGTRWQVGEPPEMPPVLFAGDTVVAPNHRGRNLFKQIMLVAFDDLADRGYRYLLNLSASRATHLMSCRMGWTSVGPLERNRWQVPAQRSPRVVPDRSPVVVSDSPRPAEMADLVARLQRDGRMRQVRDETYFSWRFKNPLCRYRFLYWEDGGLRGFAVAHWHVMRDGTDLGFVDWATSDETILAALLQTAVTSFEPASVTLWTATLPPKYRDMLSACGFADMDEPLGPGRFVPSALITTIPTERSASHIEAGRDLRDIANWDIRMIESDYY